MMDIKTATVILLIFISVMTCLKKWSRMKKAAGFLCITLLGTIVFSANIAKADMIAETLEAEDVEETSAVLVGKVNKNGGNYYTGYSFWIREVGEDEGEFVGWETGHIDSNVEYEYEVKGLKEDTKYEYYFLAQCDNKEWGENGTVYGNLVTFTTITKECDHKYIERIVDEKWDYDEEEHWYKEEIEYTCKYCDDSYSDWTDEEYSDHDFDSRGICECGYERQECRHEKTNHYYDQTEVRNTGNEKYHEIRELYNLICEECWETLENNVSNGWEEQDHDFIGNECSCGYVKEEIPAECQHKKTSHHYDRTEVRNTENEETHEFRELYNLVCEECWEVLENDVSNGWEEQKHEYNGTTCFCGYVKKTEAAEPEKEESSGACLHEKANHYYDRTEVRNTDDSETHEFCNLFNLVCELCGEVLESGISNGWEEQVHEFNGDECSCGYERNDTSDYYEEEIPSPVNCEHGKTNYYYERTEVRNTGDSEIHEFSNLFSLVCEECGEVLEREVSNGWEQQNHEYDGNLCYCGYVTTVEEEAAEKEENSGSCLHEKTNHYYDRTEVRNTGNSETHEISNLFNLVCEECGAVLEGGISNGWEEQMHEFDGDECFCGYVTSGASIHYDDEIPTPVICGHNKTNYYYEKTEVRNTGDHETHEFCNLFNLVCEECGEVLETGVNNGWEEQIHEYDGSMCFCGYEKQNADVRYEEEIADSCQHQNTNHYYDQTEVRNTGNDETHEFRNLFNLMCEECGEILENGVNNGWEKQAHSFDGGVCVCGYEIKGTSEYYDEEIPDPVVCDHRNTNHYYDRTEVRNTGNAETHEICNQFNLVCEVCWDVLESDINNGWEEQKHEFDGDVCFCGYEKKTQEAGPENAETTGSCQHGKTNHYYDRTEIRHTGSTEMHEFRNLFNLVCEECGAVLESGVSNGWEEQAHEFDGDTCICKYKKESVKEEVKHESKEEIKDVQPVDFKYRVLKAGVMITEYTGTDESVVVPDTIEGHPVVMIGDEAFAGNKTLESIVIPDGVTYIGMDAFLECKNLTTVVLPDSVEEFGDYVFDSCRALTSIALPESLTSISAGAFADCRSLTEIDIPNGVTSIGESAFSGCSGLKDVYIPGSVKSIGNYAFRECSSVKIIELRKGLESIGERAFYECSRLDEVLVPTTVTSIGKNAFDSCADDFVISGYTGSYAQTYAKKNQIEFYAFDGKEEAEPEPTAKPKPTLEPASGEDYITVSDFRINGKTKEITVKKDDVLSFEGIVMPSEGGMLSAVQMSVFLESNPEEGAKYYRKELNKAKKFDLSGVTEMKVGKTYEGFAMEPGESYIIMLYAKDTNGVGIEDVNPRTKEFEGPSILVHVEDEDSRSWDDMFIESDDEYEGVTQLETPKLTCESTISIRLNETADITWKSVDGAERYAAIVYDENWNPLRVDNGYPVAEIVDAETTRILYPFGWCGVYNIELYAQAGIVNGVSSVQSKPATITVNVAHDYEVHMDKPVKNTGKFAMPTDQGHMKVSVDYEQYCKICGTQGPDYDDYPISEYGQHWYSNDNYLNNENEHWLEDVSCNGQCGYNRPNQKKSHSFTAEGKCSICGYVKSTSVKPVSTATPYMEPSDSAKLESYIVKYKINDSTEFAIATNNEINITLTPNAEQILKVGISAQINDKSEWLQGGKAGYRYVSHKPDVMMFDGESAKVAKSGTVIVDFVDPNGKKLTTFTVNVTENYKTLEVPNVLLVAMEHKPNGSFLEINNGDRIECYTGSWDNQSIYTFFLFDQEGSLIDLQSNEVQGSGFWLEFNNPNTDSDNQNSWLSDDIVFGCQSCVDQNYRFTLWNKNDGQARKVLEFVVAYEGSEVWESNRYDFYVRWPDSIECAEKMADGSVQLKPSADYEKFSWIGTKYEDYLDKIPLLWIYDNLKGEYISVKRDDIEIAIDPGSTGKISDIQKKQGFFEYVKPGRVTLCLYVGGKRQIDQLDVYCTEDVSNQLSWNNQKDLRLSWKWAEDRYEVELTFDKVKNLPNPEFYDVGYIIRTQEYRQMRGGTRRIDTYGEPVTNQYRVGTADRKHTANVRVEMNERAVVSMYIKSRYDDSVFVMTDWAYITSCASTYWFEKAKEYNTKADSEFGKLLGEANLWDEEFSDLEIMEQIEDLSFTYGAWLNFNERLLEIFYGVPPIIIETADQLASIAKKENKDFEDICTVLSTISGVYSEVQDEAIKNLVSATLECTMNIDRVETELAIDMGKFVYEAAKGAIGAFDSPYAAMKYVVGELDKHGELKLKDEKVYIVYEVFGLNGMEIEIELQSVADYATYTLVKDALQAKKAYGNAESMFMVKDIEKLDTLSQILDNHFD